MTNVSNRLPFTKDPSKIIDVYSQDDLPDAITAADGVSRRPLAIDTRYYVHNTFDWPRCLWPVAPSLSSAFNNTDIVGARFDVEIHMDGNDTPHFWARNAAMMTFRNTHIVDVSNFGSGKGTVLWDVVGAESNGFSFLVLEYVSIRNFKSLGQMIDMSLQLEASFWSNCEAGLLARTTEFQPHTYFLGNLYFIQGGFPTKKPQITYQGEVGSSIFTGNNVNMFAGNDSIMIDSANTGPLGFEANSYGGLSKGNYFRPDVSLSLTAMAAENKSITSFTDLTNVKTVINVTDGANIGLTGTVFDTSVDNNFQVGDSVLHTGFVDGSYNGLFPITQIFTSGQYVISTITFVGDDAGTAQVDETGVDVVQSKYVRGQTFRIANATVGGYNGLHSVRRMSANENQIIIAFAHLGAATADLVSTRITTASDHPMRAGETNTISGTTSYNGTTELLFTDDNTFDIPVEFVADDATGTVVSTTQDETTVGINVQGNGVQPNSLVLGSAASNAGTTDTTPANGAYNDTNFENLTFKASVSQRISLITAAQGVFQNDSDKPEVVRFSGSITATKSGSNQDYQFAPSIDDAVPDFITDDFAPMTIESGVSSVIPFEFVVTLQPGANLRLKSGGAGTTNVFTVTDSIQSVEAVG